MLRFSCVVQSTVRLLVGPQYYFNNINDAFFQSKVHLTKDSEYISDLDQLGTKKLKKFKFLDNLKVQIPDIHPPKKIHYAFEKEGIVNIPRQVYVPAVRQSIKRRLQRMEYAKFMQAVLKENENKQEQSIIEEDHEDLWDGQGKPIRYLKKLTSKELFYNYKEPQFAQTITRKNAYLHLFEVKPVINQNIQNILQKIEHLATQQLKNIYDPNYFIEEDFYVKDPQTSKLFNQLGVELSKVSYQELPSISLFLALKLRYKIDVFQIWQKIEQDVNKHLHNYTIPQIIQLQYASSSFFPKGFQCQTSHKILQIVEDELNILNVDELLHVLAAFRHQQNEVISDKVTEILLKNVKDYYDDPNTLVRILYTIANHIPKKHQRKQSIDYNKDKKKKLALIKEFVEPLKLKTSELTTDNLSLLALAITCLKVKNLDDLFLHIENQAIQKIDQIDGFNLSQLLYAFSKGNDGYAVGSKEFYDKLSTIVPKFWNGLGNHSKSRIYYAYCARDVLPETLNKNLFLPWIKQEMEQLQYSELQNVIYGLMFSNNTDKTLWRSFARNIGFQKEVVPLSNFFAIKQAYYYISHLFNWDLTHVREAAFEAENQFSVLRLDKTIVSDENQDLWVLLQELYHFDWKNFYSFDNLYLLSAVIPNSRIALLLQTDQNSLPDGKPRPQLKLQAKILEQQDWKAPIINYKELFNRPQPEQIPYLQKLINESIESQKPKVKKWEEQRRIDLYTRASVWYDQCTIPGITKIEENDFDQLDRKI